MKSFIVAAILGILGALAALPWGDVFSAQTAGVIAMILSAGIAIVRALYAPVPSVPKLSANKADN